MTIVLHGYWRSTAAYRIRIALGLKSLGFETIAHDLRVGGQSQPDFLALNPQGLVPVLETEGLVLSQSLAILEWLDEAYPRRSLLPAGRPARAIVRSMAALVCCDIHPLNNLRVLTVLRQEFGLGEEQVMGWIARWIESGFAALHKLIEQHGGAFAFGDSPTVADCCLAPQIYSAERFAVNLSPFPRILDLQARYAREPSFRSAHPDAQMDAT